MAKKHPDCPLQNPLNCKEYFSPSICALVRDDRDCQRRKKTEEGTQG